VNVLPTQFAARVALQRDKVPDFDEYPFSLPVVRTLHAIDLHPKVTFLVGENGSGKSTLLEAIAVAMEFNPEGGSRNFNFRTQESHSDLHKFLRIGKGVRPRDAYFLRAESLYNVATAIDRLGVNYAYGGGYGTGDAPTFQGRSVTGGYVYRGPLTELQGKYIFGDWSSRQMWAMQIDRDANGGLGALVPGSLVDLSTALSRQLSGGGAGLGVTAFGEDQIGSLYYVQLDGNLFKIVPEPSTLSLFALGLPLLAARRRPVQKSKLN